MRKLTACFVCLTALMMLNASCKKSNEPSATDTVSLLKDKYWKLTALTIDPALGGITDLYNSGFMDDCDKDDLFMFRGDGHCLYNTSALHCDVTESQETSTGNWQYYPATHVLHFQIFDYGDSYDLTVTDINDNLLRGTMKDTIASDIYTSTWTFTKQ